MQHKIKKYHHAGIICKRQSDRFTNQQQLSSVMISVFSQACAIVTVYTLGKGERDKAYQQGYAFLGLDILFGGIASGIIMLISTPMIAAYNLSPLTQAIAKEIVTRYSNPDWIKGMMQEGYSGARYISNKFLTDLLGWSVTRPEAVSNYMWDDAYDVYFNDKYGVGVTDWLKTGNNNYAFISSAGTMLTAAYEGYWKTDSATISDIANQWAEAVIANGVACCDCSCGNIAMMQWAVDFINPDLLAKFADQLFQATHNNFFNPINFQDNPDPHSSRAGT